MSSKDTDLYMKRIKQKSSGTEEVMQKIKSDKLAELDKLRIEAEMDEIKTKMSQNKQRLIQGQKQPIGGQIQPREFLETLFFGRKPEEIDQILDSLDENKIQKLRMLTAAMDNSQLGLFMTMMNKPQQSINETIQLIKTVSDMNRPSQETSVGSTLKGVAALMKEQREAMDTRGHGEPETNAYQKLLERALDEAKAYREHSAKQDMLRIEKEIAELKNRPTFAQELAQKMAEYDAFQKKFGGGGTPNLEVEKLRMQQHEQDLGHDRWKYEQEYRQRKEYQEMMNKRESDKERNKLIKEIAVPALKRIAPALDAAVKAGQRKINTLATSSGAARNEMVDKFLCPKCLENNIQSVIDVAGMPEVAKCPTCKAEFPRGQK